MVPRASSPLYDTIGHHYAHYRQPDPRIAALLVAALGDARRVLNVGAGTGSYEPADRDVTALEISSTMIAQRPAGAAPCVQGSAAALPFGDNAFDAAMALLTIHHWPDWRQGLREMRRVAPRVVVWTWDPEHPGFWLTQKYFPDIPAYDLGIFPRISEISALLETSDVRVVPIPHDCTDGFLGAYWRRPEMYLDEGARRAISTFSRIGDVAPRIARLRADIDSGVWAREQHAILREESLDLGYRIVVTS